MKATEHSRGIYQSLISKNQECFCMDFNPTSTRYPDMLVQSSFDREVKYLKALSKYAWSPEVTNIDYTSRKIYFKWYGNTCEDRLPEDFEIQLEQIVSDLHSEGIYKPSFYPKYFYVDQNNCIHTYTFYSASDYSEQPIDIEFYRPILNHDRLAIVEKLAPDGKLDVKLLIEQAFNNYIKWPSDILPKIYERIYG